MIGANRVKIKADLPTFPDEVIDTWIVPIAKDAGWPPLPGSRWSAILLNKPLSFWQSLEWSREHVVLSYRTLDAPSRARVKGLIDANVHGVYNDFAQQIADTRPRFNSVLRYLQNNTDLPAPPVLLQGWVGYTVVDGNHRVAAYMAARDAAIPGPICWVGRPSRTC